MSTQETASLVYVRWFDCALYKGEACSPDELSGYCENESCGLLVADSDDSITLALDRCLDTSEVRCVLCIPRVNIRTVRYLHASRTADEEEDD